MINRVFNTIYADIQDYLHIRRKPLTIQLPITGKCNSRCVTCNVWKPGMQKKDIDAEKLKTILSHSYFSSILSVGINGGEISLYKDIEKLIDAILVLPKLNGITVISNGLLQDRLLERLEIIHSKCKERGVSVALILSLDSVGETHDIVRGIDGAFEKTSSTLKAVLANKSKYCNSVRLGCTISQKNVYELYKVEEYANELGVDVDFHLAVPNKRIRTFDDADRYTVLGDEQSRLLAMEFFRKKTAYARTIGEKIRYYSHVYYLKNKGKGRLASCNFRFRDITIDENINFYLCATASDSLGNLYEEGVAVVTSRARFNKIEKQVLPNCDTCIHYCWAPTFKGLCIVGFDKFKRLFHDKQF